MLNFLKLQFLSNYKCFLSCSLSCKDFSLSHIPFEMTMVNNKNCDEIRVDRLQLSMYVLCEYCSGICHLYTWFYKLLFTEVDVTLYIKACKIVKLKTV